MKTIASVLALGNMLASATVAEPGSATVPQAVITLFNGKDLAPFYTWLPRYGHADPDRVFSVVEAIDGGPAIRISGQHYGGLITRERFANYRLVVEFRWGLATWEPRKSKARDSGILLHCAGEDGNRLPTFASPWMRSVEFQIIEGGTGDIILVNGYDRGVSKAIAPQLTVAVLPGDLHWNPQGVPSEFNRGWLGWQHRDREWQDTLGFRGARDMEKPWGQWNRLEAICEGGDLTYFVNGVRVMEGKNGSFHEGKILFQSEGAEIYFRRIELHPLHP